MASPRPRIRAAAVVVVGAYLALAWGPLLWLLVIAIRDAADGAGGPIGAPGQGVSWWRVADRTRESLLVAGGATLAALVGALLALPGLWAADRGARRALFIAGIAPLFVPSLLAAMAGIETLGANGWMTRIAFGPLNDAPGLVATAPPIGSSAARFLPPGMPIPAPPPASPPSPSAAPGSIRKPSTVPIYTRGGVIGVLALCYAPLTLAALAAALRARDRSIEESALLETSPANVFFRVVLPPLWPVIAAGLAATFAHAFVDFGVPEALRAWPTLPTEVYTQLGVYYDPASGARVALVSSLGAAIVIGVAIWLLRRAAPLFSGAAPGSEDLDPGDERGATAALARSRGGWRFAGWRALAILMTGVPIAIVLFSLLRSSLEGGGFANWRTAWSTGYPEILNSTRLAAAAALAATVFGAALGESVARLPVRGSLGFLLLLAVPMLLPGPVPAAAWLDLLSRVGAAGWEEGAPATLQWLGRASDFLRDSPLALILVWTIRWAPLVALFYVVGRRRVPVAWLEAARLEGAAGWRLWTTCLRPWVVAPAIAGGAIVWALAWGEAGSAILLVPPDTTPLSVRILTLLHFAPTSTMASLALIGVAAGLLGLLAAIALLARTPRSTPRTSIESPSATTVFRP